jgi:hypothetical protein
MTVSELRQDTGPWYRLYDADDVPLPAIQAMADASQEGLEVHGLPRIPIGRPPQTDEEMAALPRSIVFFPPYLRGMAETFIGEGITPDSMANLGLRILVAPDSQSPTGDSWVCLRNRAEVNKMMQHIAAQTPGAIHLVIPEKDE